MMKMRGTNTSETRLVNRSMMFQLLHINIDHQSLQDTSFFFRSTSKRVSQWIRRKFSLRTSLFDLINILTGHTPIKVRKTFFLSPNRWCVEKEGENRWTSCFSSQSTQIVDFLFFSSSSYHYCWCCTGRVLTSISFSRLWDWRRNGQIQINLFHSSFLWGTIRSRGIDSIEYFQSFRSLSWSSGWAFHGEQF